MTTVGYGDLSPTTTGGKMLAAVVMIVGIGFVAVLTGAVEQRFLAPQIERETTEVEEELDATGEAMLRELRGVRAQLDGIEAAVLGSRRPEPP
jgi:voltage-gated potassium channel